MEQENLLKIFWIKVGDCGTKQTFEKAARNWHDSKTKLQHWKHTEYLLFFCSIMFIHKLDIIGRIKSFVCKFAQLQYYQILLKSVNIWRNNNKSKKGELFETQCSIIKSYSRWNTTPVIRTRVDTNSDRKPARRSFRERDNIVQLRWKSEPLLLGRPARTVRASDVRCAVRYQANVRQVREADDVIFPRIPLVADVKL